MITAYGSCKITLTGTTPGQLNLDIIFGEVESLHELQVAEPLRRRKVQIFSRRWDAIDDTAHGFAVTLPVSGHPKESTEGGHS